jgi:hypothetical protein
MILELPLPVLVVTLPLPSSDLSSNARANRWDKARAVKAAREGARLDFLAVMRAPVVGSRVSWKHGTHWRSGVVRGLSGAMSEVEFASGSRCSVLASRLRVEAGPWPLAGATCLPVFYRRNERHHLKDETNDRGFMKPVFDGAADAGLVANDKDIRSLPAELRVDKKNPRLVVYVYAGRMRYGGEGAP